jgi:hypothetical protein
MAHGHLGIFLKEISVDPKDWNEFFDLVEKIVNQPGTVQEKSMVLNYEATSRSAEGDLAELAAMISE